MSLIVTQPRDLFTHLDSVFNRAWTDYFGDKSILDGHSKTNYPKVDVVETDTDLIMEATVPGLTKENVKVFWEDDILTISSFSTYNCNVNKPDDRANYKIKEIHKSSFRRGFKIAQDYYAVDKITAETENGILTITIPKIKPTVAKTKKITIQ